MGIAWAIDNSRGGNLLTSTVDPVTERYQANIQLYLDTCGSCHVPVPPGVLPTETWQTLLEKPDIHYGTSVNLVRISQVLIWEYLRTFSRPLSREEPRPIYVGQSRYFKALHPRVDLPKPVTHRTCIDCHPAAAQFDYTRLSPQWDDSP